MSGQPWQAGTESNENVNPDTGEGVPSWQFKIEGRLLEVRVSVSHLQRVVSTDMPTATESTAKRQAASEKVFDDDKKNGR